MSALLSVAFLGWPTAPPRAYADASGVAATPLMGWSSWSFLRDHVDEANVELQAKALHDSGLQAAGYRYVKIDDWYYLDPAQHVDGYGRWVTDPSKFPHGMAAVAAYVHSLGLKFGLYMTPGVPVAAYNQNTPIEGTPYHARDIVSDTAAHEVNFAYGEGSMYRIDYRKPGSQAFINSWANLLAAWGIDALKIDAVGDGTIDDVKAWSHALRAAGRDIYFELSSPYAGQLSVANGDVWRMYSNSWRTDGDIECCRKGAYPLTRWDNIVSRFLEVPPYVPLAGPGGWNDLDALELGNGNNDGLTLAERETMSDAWALFASPLVLGSDLTALDPDDYRLISDPAVIAIDQAGHPAHPVGQSAPHSEQQVWSARNDDGSYNVGLFNLGKTTATVGVRWADDLGFERLATVRAVRQRQDLGRYGTSFSAPLAAHASLLLRVVPDDLGTKYRAATRDTRPTVRPATEGCAACPDVQNAPSMSTSMGNDLGSILFPSVVAPVTGTYQVEIDYASPDGERRANVSVNGAAVVAYRFPPTHPSLPASPLRIALALTAGSNTIVLANPQAPIPDVSTITVSAAPIDAVIGDQPPRAVGTDPIGPLEGPSGTPEVGGPTDPEALPQ